MKKIFILCIFVLFVINSVDALTCRGKTSHEVALEVIAGDWGNGDTRVLNFSKFCIYPYDYVQREVNRILYGN